MQSFKQKLQTVLRAIKSGWLLVLCVAMCGCQVVRVAGQHQEPEIPENFPLEFRINSYTDNQGQISWKDADPAELEGVDSRIVEYVKKNETEPFRDQLERELCARYPQLFSVREAAYPLDIQIDVEEETNRGNVFTVISTLSAFLIPVSLEDVQSYDVSVRCSISGQEIGRESVNAQWRWGMALHPGGWLMVPKKPPSTYVGETVRVFKRGLSPLEGEDLEKMKDVCVKQCAYAISKILTQADVSDLKRRRILQENYDAAYE